MATLAQVGEFCPNPECPDYGKSPGASIIKFGKTKAGRQRFRCHCCGRTFTETKGTLFYRRRTPAPEIIESLAFIAEGSRVSSVARVKAHKEDTILAWIRGAGAQAEAIEAALLQDHRIQKGQLDGLWAYVGNKGEKKAILKRRKAASSGVPR